MSSDDSVNVPLSRPKVHRPPAFLSPKKRNRFQQAGALVRSCLLPHMHRSAYRGVRMGLLLVSVSAALFILSRAVGTGGDARVTVAAISRLEPAAGDAMASIPEMEALTVKTAKTIHIEGKTGAIIGQLARIPSENGNISDIKTVSEVDNRAGRELLSIISKY